MYVTTFYSFKGGVGRTFALVNVGVELARTGRKVLLVDFDLEAPGVHTFNALSPKRPHPGMVECVTDYMATQAAPDVRQYVYEVENVAEQDGRMWVMPAGRGDREYRQRLASVNWQSLYQESDGYLFFEDLKAQWKEAYDPDYVLVDSRTGHTDIEGICTRQLPDAAVILFFPNEQNLCGLREVVRDIKAESDKTRKNAKPVTLHFVMSNVPDLDDEDGILRDRIREFRRALECETLSRIHNYPSLALLNQTIFTKERTKSRLAREYRRLKDQIVDENDEDPEGVARFLKGIVAPDSRGARSGLADTDERLKSIQKEHADNGEVNFLLGLVAKSQASLSEAVACFDRAMEIGYRRDVVLLERATCWSMLGNHKDAIQDVEELLGLANLDGYKVYRAAQLLRESESHLLERIPQSTAFRSLSADEKWMVARTLENKGANASSAEVYSSLIKDTAVPEGLKRDVRIQLAFTLIGLCRYDEAIRLIGVPRPDPCSLGIHDAFNYAMAEWAQTGIIARDLFARVVDLADTLKPVTANHEQCFSLAFWAIEDVEEGERRISNAEELGKRIKQNEFSCWRYSAVSRDSFLEDCKAIRKLIRTGEGRPLFFPNSERQ